MGARLRVRVTPRASRDEFRGWREGELQVRVTAPPEAGRATAAVCKAVAASLGVPKSAVTVIRGDTARHKTLEIAGVHDADIERAFGTDEAR